MAVNAVCAARHLFWTPPGWCKSEVLRASPRRIRVSAERSFTLVGLSTGDRVAQSAWLARNFGWPPSHRPKNDVPNVTLDGSPVRGPAGREPILFTLPFENGRLNGRKSRSGYSVPGSGRLCGISRPNTRFFLRQCL